MGNAYSAYSLEAGAAELDASANKPDAVVLIDAAMGSTPDESATTPEAPPENTGSTETTAPENTASMMHNETKPGRFETSNHTLSHELGSE